jgi:hypothetical protein
MYKMLSSLASTTVVLKAKDSLSNITAYQHHLTPCRVVYLCRGSELVQIIQQSESRISSGTACLRFFSRASECEREACALDQLRLSDPQAKAVDPQIEPECELRRTAAATSRSVGP